MQRRVTMSAEKGGHEGDHECREGDHECKKVTMSAPLLGICCIKELRPVGAVSILD